ncbi:hypothetical protein M2451_002680 [Dysgonomonas sp. PFB1-18]|uniref:hypothetical protein n=1 Tax=unclassified Dysgonomonas TaxID=2630389 RepID=UPI002475B3A4|nr:MULTISPECIES: hypothetical protein [unclassified Dysgonomonas]MDH6309434.1 hypothetical protein [Dysgonomonas sp. PF1-14]MDH6339701.1 hypothetical protein [Dysgonomonas sp. PF1-16]MDH6381349.1 hypothetical protein [Dysgonomonas sp. PFB1-18]MDH6398564.1 hypothetical protein [Dysgonomonas sp. PF1-23]
MAIKRNVLLLEPNYKNKYPPIGLMKLATYHRQIGDHVTFYKGSMKEFIIKQATQLCIADLSLIRPEKDWNFQYDRIWNYIKTRRKTHLEGLEKDEKSVLCKYKDYYWKKEYIKNPIWDRICITTLFTFYWDVTIETIKFAKDLVKTPSELWIGGVMSTILHNEIKEETGVNSWKGLMNKKHILDKDNDFIIDEMSLDYSILDEIDYKYSKSSAYYGYMTRGCIRKCPFCAVPTLEPTFNNYISLKEKIEHTNRLFGRQQNLLLLDNNVLASDSLTDIVEEIKNLGFYSGAKYLEPNQLDLAVRNLRLAINDKAYIQKSKEILTGLFKRLQGRKKDEFMTILNKYDVENIAIITKSKILEIYPHIHSYYDEFHNRKKPKQRFIDFNQGLDARLINDTNMALLSQIAIRPMRIAFDSIKDQNKYLSAINCAAKHDIKHFSNYLLYNFKDTPIELYQRLKLNVDLCEELNVNIYSFPMKYHPISDNLFYANRNYLGRNWNRKFIRAIQTILNATKGKVGRGKSFFIEAFGENEEVFTELLYMPEPFILYRKFFRENGFTEKWREAFYNLSIEERELAKEIISTNIFKTEEPISDDIKKLLDYYSITC